RVFMKQGAEEPNKDALADRPLTSGTGTSMPHDAIPHSQWKNGFAAAAGAVGISTSNQAYTMMTGFFSARPRRHAVADGPSVQPFDGEIHKDRSAVQRHDDTAGKALTDIWLLASATSPTVGNVTVEEYQGKDWARLKTRDEKMAAMQVRAELVISAI